jgi:class 3 adenylate cyclase/HAMP domain-containing protein
VQEEIEMSGKEGKEGFLITFSLRLKIILTFFIISSLVGVSLSYSTYRILGRSLFRELQNRVYNLTQVGSHLIDTDALSRLIGRMSPALGDDEVFGVETSEDFRIISDQLNLIRDTEKKLVRYVYIFVPTKDENTALFVVDADTLPQFAMREAGEMIGEEDFSHFNSLFEIIDFPVARQVIEERVPKVEQEYTYDEAFNVNSISGYAPIFDRNSGRFLAVLGLDMVDTDVKSVLRNITTLSLFITAGALVLSFIVSILLGSLFTRGIIQLDRVVRTFDKTNLAVRADIKSRDEVGRLGFSFNQMADIIQRYSSQLKALLRAYGRFVPHDFLRFLQKKSILEVSLGDQVQREMTVMFSDIRSFTELSETMSPEENFNFLNSYLSRVGPEIRSNSGFIDKYIGDGIMALFPEKPDDALQAAVAMLRKVDEYNDHRRKSGYRPIGIGIGIHTGNLMLGTVGEKERMDGSVIADAVNLCARLESLTRLYGSSILVSGQTLKLLAHKDAYHHRFVDRVRVKGKKELVLIYEVFDADPPEMKRKKIAGKIVWTKALFHYYDRDFKNAFKLFKLLKEKHPQDRIYDLYLRRSVRCIKFGVPADWQGIEVVNLK